MQHHHAIVKRVLTAIGIGAICGAIIGAAGFALSELVFGRGVGIFGSSPSLGALFGAVYLGVCGAGMGALIGMLDLSAPLSGAVGSACGVLLILGERWRSGTRYFYESGYVDRHLIFSDIVHWMTVVMGCALAAMAVSAVLRKGSGTGK